MVGTNFKSGNRFAESLACNNHITSAQIFSNPKQSPKSNHHSKMKMLTMHSRHITKQADRFQNSQSTRWQLLSSVGLWEFTINRIKFRDQAQLQPCRFISRRLLELYKYNFSKNELRLSISTAYFIMWQ